VLSAAASLGVISAAAVASVRADAAAIRSSAAPMLGMATLTELPRRQHERFVTEEWASVGAGGNASSGQRADHAGTYHPRPSPKKTVTECLVEHLERAGFVVMKWPPIGGGAALARGFRG
jgi:hypothetical protein